RREPMRLPLTPALLLLSSLCACSSHKPRTDAPASPQQHVAAHIEDITWRLASAGGKYAGTAPSGATPANFRLNSTGKNVSGFSGVNQFSGDYQLDGRSLTFGPLAMTRRAGPPELMQQEAAITKALTST